MISKLSQIVLKKINTSKLGTDQAGKFMPLDELVNIFESVNKTKLTESINELRENNFIRYTLPDRKDLFSMTPFGEDYLNNPEDYNENNKNSNSNEFRLSVLEDDILRFLKKKRDNKDTPAGLMHDYKNTNKDIADSELKEAIDILVYQKYLKKTTKSTKFDPKVFNKYSKEKAHTIKTEYVELTGKALLYLNDRVSNSDTKTTEIFDNTSPYKIRRKIENIFESSKKDILIVDNYIGRKTLDYLTTANANIKIITSSVKENNFDSALDDFTKQYLNNIEVKVVDGELHGRFIIADNKYFLLDHSIKDFGSKPSTMIEILDTDAQRVYRDLFEKHWNK